MVTSNLTIETVAMDEFESNLEPILDRVSRGEEIQVAVNGQPRFKIVPITPEGAATHDRESVAARAREIEEGFAALTKVPGLTHDQILKELHQDRDGGGFGGAGSGVA